MRRENKYFRAHRISNDLDKQNNNPISPRWILVNFEYVSVQTIYY